MSFSLGKRALVERRLITQANTTCAICQTKLSGRAIELTESSERVWWCCIGKCADSLEARELFRRSPRAPMNRERSLVGFDCTVCGLHVRQWDWAICAVSSSEGGSYTNLWTCDYQRCARARRTRFAFEQEARSRRTS